MAAKNPKLLINLDLLKPQSNPEKLPVKFFRWLFSSGRFIFIFVEALVLIVFIVRFKFDAELADKKDAIDKEAVFIQSLKPYEILIRQTQAKLSTIQAFRTSTPDYTGILKKIADQTPAGVKLSTINLTKNVSKVSLSINGQAQTNSDLAAFLGGLKESSFDQVAIASVGLEEGFIHFVINANASVQGAGKNL